MFCTIRKSLGPLGSHASARQSGERLKITGTVCVHGEKRRSFSDNSFNYNQRFESVELSSESGLVIENMARQKGEAHL